MKVAQRQGCGFIFSAFLVCAADLAIGAEVKPWDDLPRLERKYEACVQVRLNEAAAEFHDVRVPIRRAMLQCDDRKLETAGQFALDNPGTKGTQAFIDHLDATVMESIKRWLSQPENSFRAEKR